MRKALLFVVLFVVLLIGAVLYLPTPTVQAQTVPPVLPTITYDTPDSYNRLCPNCVFLPTLNGGVGRDTPFIPVAFINIVSSSYNPVLHTITVEVVNASSDTACAHGVEIKAYLDTGEFYTPMGGNGVSVLAPWEKGTFTAYLPYEPISNYSVSSLNGNVCQSSYYKTLRIEDIQVAIRVRDCVGCEYKNKVQIVVSNPYTYTIASQYVRASLYDHEGTILNTVGADYSFPSPILLPGATMTLTANYRPEDYPSIPEHIHVKAYGTQLR